MDWPPIRLRRVDFPEPEALAMETHFAAGDAEVDRHPAATTFRLPVSPRVF